MEQFNLKNQWLKYLELAGVKEAQLGEVQRSEMKKCFYGACGQLLILFRDELAAIADEDKAVATMEDMMQQVHDFWINAAKREN